MTLWFWLIFFAALLCITVSSAYAFEKQWGRSAVCAFFAFDCFALMSTGWI